MSNENNEAHNPSFGKRMWTAFKRLIIFLFWVLLTLVVLGVIGTAIYLGAPVVINDYLLKDVKVNSEKLQDIDTEMKANNALFTQRLEDLQARIEALEIQSDTDKQTIDEVKAQLADAEAAIADQSSAISNLESLLSSLDELGEALTALEDRISLQDDTIEDLEDKILSLGGFVEGNQEELEALKAQLEAQAKTGTLRQELELLKVMELITRARVSLGQDNTGLAKDDLQAAQDLIAVLSAELPELQAEYLKGISERLAMAAENLTTAPKLVDEDLEAAWQLLLQRLPSEPEDTSPALTPTPTPQP